MKNIIHKIIAVTSIFILMTGCLTISLHPIYNEEDLVLNDNIIGEWLGARSIWTFSKSNDLSYVLNYKECQEPINDPANYSSCTLATFKVNFIKIDDYYFADFYPIDYSNTDNQLLLFHLRAFHSFAKFEVIEDELKVTFLDDQWLERLIEKKPKAIDHLETFEGVILTAGTDQLQDFISQYVNDEHAFSSSIELKR